MNEGPEAQGYAALELCVEEPRSVSVRLTRRPGLCPTAPRQGLRQCSPWPGASPAPSGGHRSLCSPGGLAVCGASPGSYLVLSPPRDEHFIRRQGGR